MLYTYFIFFQMSFSDTAPLLVASEASMELLNSKLEEKLEIERFRPNIIVTGCTAHAEVNASMMLQCCTAQVHVH